MVTCSKQEEPTSQSGGTEQDVVGEDLIKCNILVCWK